MDKKFGVGERERAKWNLNNIPLSLTFHHLKQLFPFFLNAELAS